MDSMQGADGMSMHLPGSFAGHMVPGSLFLLWVVFWIWELIRYRGMDGPPAVERFLIVKLGKVVFPLVGVQLELVRMDGLFSTASWNNLSHATMYTAFALAGVVDLAETRGRVPPDGTGAERSFVSFVWHVLTISAALFGLRALTPRGRGNQ